MNLEEFQEFIKAASSMNPDGRAHIAGDVSREAKRFENMQRITTGAPFPITQPIERYFLGFLFTNGLLVNDNGCLCFSYHYRIGLTFFLAFQNWMESDQSDVEIGEIAEVTRGYLTFCDELYVEASKRSNELVPLELRDFIDLLLPRLMAMGFVTNRLGKLDVTQRALGSAAMIVDPNMTFHSKTGRWSVRDESALVAR